jgi:hypothetical protein
MVGIRSTLSSKSSAPISQTVSGKFGVSQLSEKIQTVSEKFGEIRQTPSAKFTLADIAKRFPLPWSHYVLLLSVKNLAARSFYETEVLSGGWSVRQLDRQINSQF